MGDSLDYDSNVLERPTFQLSGTDFGSFGRVLFKPKQKAIAVSVFEETGRFKEAKQLGAGTYVKKP